jgi:hypothetical protein
MKKLIKVEIDVLDENHCSNTCLKLQRGICYAEYPLPFLNGEKLDWDIDYYIRTDHCKKAEVKKMNELNNKLSEDLRSANARAESAERELGELRERIKYLEGDKLPDTLTCKALREWLSLRGYEGLYCEDCECGCELSDLMPCGEGYQSCSPGYKKEDGRGEYSWVIVPEQAIKKAVEG